MASAQTPSIRKAILHCGADVEARLIYYPGGLIQSPHVHEEGQLSVLLAGALCESVRRRDVETVRRASGYKQPGLRHAASFGPNGALMLSLTLEGALDAPHAPCEWRPTHASVDALIAALLNTDDAVLRAAITADLLVALKAAPETTEPPADPRHAGLLKEAFDDAPGAVRIGEMARSLGVHRVHLTRQFMAAYGQAPSLYRARAMAAKALAGAVGGADALADVAADAGFADQSHLARTSRRHIGVPLSRVRGLFAEATSVQAVAG